MKERQRKNITFFDESNGNSVMGLLKYFSKIYEGDERTYIDKDGDEIVSSYGLFWLRTFIVDSIAGLH